MGYRMTEEVERAKAAIDYTKQGLKVVVISGGDPGVYGMAVLYWNWQPLKG